MSNRKCLVDVAVSAALMQASITQQYTQGEHLDVKHLLTCGNCQLSFREHVKVVWPHIVELLAPVPDNVVRLRR